MEKQNEWVMQQLKAYSSNKMKLSLLEYELTNIQTDSAGGERIRAEWQNVHGEVERLEKYMELLDDELRQVLVCIFLEKKTWDKMVSERNLSEQSIRRRKQKAIRMLAEMHSYMEKLTKA